MKCRVITFGVARDILGGKEMNIDFDGSTVGELKAYLKSSYPAFHELNSLFVAVNHAYAADHIQLASNDEIAIIPPVSGG